MLNKECIFCRIIKGEIPCDKIYEDEDIISFLDINPYVKGHLLIIPKKHSRWIWDMEDEDYANLNRKTKFLANILRKTFSIEWVEEVIAGMGVLHTHIHLLPRFPNDELGEIPTKPLNPKLSKEEIKEIAKKIRNTI
jgi:histidine triad (HIT) family protein